MPASIKHLVTVLN